MTQLLIGLVFIGAVVIASQFQRQQKQLQPIPLQRRGIQDDH